MRYFSWQILSMPIPNAKPVYLLGSMPKFCSIFGCTIPLPRISTQPLCLHTLHPDAAADQAADIHLRTGFREWKIRRAETDLHRFAEHFLHKKIKRLLQIGERNIFIHIQSFALVEKTMRPGADGFIPVYAARTNDPYGRFLFFHHPGLHTAGMGAQQPVRDSCEYKKYPAYPAQDGPPAG